MGRVAFTFVGLLSIAALAAQYVPSVYNPGATSPVARHSSCSTVGTGCTFGAASTGDLQIVEALAAASVTISLPSGWTQLATQNTNAPSVLIGCHVASSGSDTSSTWTNATDVIGLSYSGTGAVNATCNTTGIGGAAYLTFGASGTTYTFTGFTFSPTGSYWVAGFSGGSSGTPCATTTNLTGTPVTVGSSGRQGAANDSNSAISSFATQTCTGFGGTAHYASVMQIL